VYVPPGTFAASKDETTNGPTWTSNLFITHTHTTHKLEHLKQCARAKSDLTTKHHILDGNVSSSVSCNLQMS
jgi:hypothetical protein